MKSSLAQVFRDVSDAAASKDRIFPTRTCVRKITDESGADVPSETVLVVAPYDETIECTEKTSTLLVDSGLRKEYENLHKEIDVAKESLVAALKKQSKSKRVIEQEVSSTFTRRSDEFYRALERIRGEVEVQKDAPFASIPYDTVFDDRVRDTLNTKDFKTVIKDYIQRYAELLDKSMYFKKGVFEYYNASNIARTLADNGFFDAKHTVNLNAATRTEVTTQEELETLIAKEKEGISQDRELKRKFDEIEKLLNKTASLRDFKAYILKHDHLLPHLADLEAFKEDVWKSFLKVHENLCSDLLSKKQAAEARKTEIEKKAGEQRTQWENVIEIFNERFVVPFKLTASNRIPVILGAEPMLNLAFEFKDDQDSAPVDRRTLLQVLSQGEKKALYILNVIFEIEARRKLAGETVLVVDDIADSFDYKNKYAIIQYLKEIAERPNFRLIILTHNFDFFRIVQSRFVPYKHCLAARKDVGRVALDQAVGIQNVFVKDWKPNYFTDQKKKVACIPFTRNIIEYTKGEDEPSFKKLTSLLHWKADTAGILEGDLDRIYCEVFGQSLPADGRRPVVDIVFEQAEQCLVAPVGANFEHKIVLSIATRLRAEKFMVDRIADPTFTDAIDANQTSRLMTKFIERFPTDPNTKVLQNVVLMTPENIHLNSFMYEPILDMSDDHLRRLYDQVKSLT
jgi:hypothetical protein